MVKQPRPTINLTALFKRLRTVPIPLLIGVHFVNVFLFLIIKASVVAGVSLVISNRPTKLPNVDLVLRGVALTIDIKINMKIHK